MTERILVEVLLPAAGRSYDIFIPYDARLSNVVKQISSALEDLSNGQYSAMSNSILCDADSGIILNINMRICELGLKNGSRLMLI